VYKNGCVQPNVSEKGCACSYLLVVTSRAADIAKEQESNTTGEMCD